MASIVLFMVTALACGSSRGAPQVGPAVPGNDVIKDAVEHLVRGASISEGRIKDLRAAIEKANEAMGETENTLQQITAQLGTRGGESLVVIREAGRKYGSVSEYMRAAGRKLVRVATQTRAACEQFEVGLQGWDREADNVGKNLILEDEFVLMETLMDDILEAFEDVSRVYGQANNAIGQLDNHLRDFALDLTKMLDEDSKEHEIWSSCLKRGKYATARGQATLGSVVADVFGGRACTGIGSVITAGFLFSKRANTAEVSAKIRSLKGLTEEAIKDFVTFQDKTSNLIDDLSREDEDAKIVDGWKNRAGAVLERIESAELGEFEQLPRYKGQFSQAVISLRELAKMLRDS